MWFPCFLFQQQTCIKEKSVIFWWRSHPHLITRRNSQLLTQLLSSARKFLKHVIAVYFFVRFNKSNVSFLGFNCATTVSLNCYPAPDCRRATADAFRRSCALSRSLLSQLSYNSVVGLPSTVSPPREPHSWYSLSLVCHTAAATLRRRTAPRLPSKISISRLSLKCLS